MLPLLVTVFSTRLLLACLLLPDVMKAFEPATKILSTLLAVEVALLGVIVIPDPPEPIELPWPPPPDSLFVFKGTRMILESCEVVRRFLRVLDEVDADTCKICCTGSGCFGALMVVVSPIPLNT